MGRLDPLEVVAGLVLEDGRRWAEAATEVQLAVARAVLDPAKPGRHWIGRSRGYSKTTDAAALTIGALLGGLIRPGERGYCCAADRDQARLLLEAMRGFISRTPALRPALQISALKITAPATGTEVVVVPADAASAYGLRGSWFVVDELCQWADTPGARQFWDAISTAFPKVAHCRVMVISTAGDPGHFSRAVYDHAIASQLWTVSEAHGPPPWISDEVIRAERDRLPESTFRRLWQNEWAAPEDRLVLIDDLEACSTLTDWPLDHDPCHRPYVVTVDLGLKQDHTVACVAHSEPTDDTGTVIVLDRLMVWEGTRPQPVSLTEVEAAVAAASRGYGSATVLVDPWQAALLVERLRARQITVEEYPFTSQSIGRLAQALYARLRGHGLRLPVTNPELIGELANSSCGRPAPAYSGSTTAPAATTTAPSPSAWPASGSATGPTPGDRPPSSPAASYANHRSPRSEARSAGDPTFRR